MRYRHALASGFGFAAMAVLGSSSAQDLGELTGNRYDRPREYVSEMSASAAYLAMQKNKIVGLDVRSLPEYAAGHAERAYNVPYPRIYPQGSGLPGQTAEDFYWAVYDLVKGKTDAPIVTFCRTGSRSIDAANILADPENTADDPRRHAVPGGVPFTNVRNNWEGMVGQFKYAYQGGNLKLVENEDGELVGVKLDLNGDGIINDDVADVYEDVFDANPDRDGWRNFLDLDWTTKIRKPLAYLQDKAQYSPYQIPVK